MSQKPAESLRMESDLSPQEGWRKWGPYVAYRQWGTVREDYSSNGDCWEYFPHDHSRSRAFRWGEDGLFGFSDLYGRLIVAPAFWNHQDSILKERLFGLTGPQGNNGEDVKECYYHLVGTPSHSYMKVLYKYPQTAFPYQQLLDESRRRERGEPEFELLDTGIFDDSRYFDIFIEWAKADVDDLILRIEVVNRASVPAPISVLGSVFFRNTWSWGRSGSDYPTQKPRLSLSQEESIIARHIDMDVYGFSADPKLTDTVALFTENESNYKVLFGIDNPYPYVKDSFHNYVVHNQRSAVNPLPQGTKACFLNQVELGPGESRYFRYRLQKHDEGEAPSSEANLDDLVEVRAKEAREFSDWLQPDGISSVEREVFTQATAGLLWTKQFYYYSVAEWREGDPAQPLPNPKRAEIRNVEWDHLYNRDILSMPDKWEYPWYAAWDTAFHMVPFARIDPEFTKNQLLLFLREWYMHPNGQIPAYEFAFSDVNPPVHAWACWRVYKMTAPKGKRDRSFLAKAFHKLLVNFTWWVNRKDLLGNNLFSGGFLGLDNIGVFDRSAPLPIGDLLEQADATAWMAFYCSNMLAIALELASYDTAYSDIATKFFEHFIAITDAINNFGGNGLWNDIDGFYYDVLHINDSVNPLKVRSLVGLIPVLAVGILEDQVIERLPEFKGRMNWFLQYNRDISSHLEYKRIGDIGYSGLRLLSVPSRSQLERIFSRLFDENEFLSDFGIRSLSKVHQDYPYTLLAGNETYRVSYSPGEPETGLFGGNSNWRGPIWFPINFLLVEALERYHYYYGDSFLVEFPTRSGRFLNLLQISQQLCYRLTKLFLPRQEDGLAPFFGGEQRFSENPEWRDLYLFHEFFHGDNGKGLGAMHQTGWTALVIRCIEKVVFARNAGVELF